MSSPNKVTRQKVKLEIFNASDLRIVGDRAALKPDSFGSVLALILGSAKKSEAAQRLSINSTTLSSILHGSDDLSQKLIEDKGWRHILATYYPVGWQKYSRQFELYAARLSLGKKGREPADKESFGYVLWCILGGPDAKVSEAAQRVNIAQTTLSSILHGRYNPTQSFILHNHWYEILEKYYPMGWTRFGDTLKSRADKLSSRSNESQISLRSARAKTSTANLTSKPKPTHVPLGWRQDASALVARVIHDRGDDIDCIAHEAHQYVLRKPQTWLRITQADASLPEGIYESAIRELTRLYELKGVPDSKDYQDIQTLLYRRALG